MIIKNLHFSGCSFVAGTSLRLSTKEGGKMTNDEKMSKNFHTLLSKKLNVPNVNIGSPGGSNKKAIRLVFDKVRNSNVEGTLFILGLSELYRTEKFSTHVNRIIKWRYETVFKHNEKIAMNQSLIPMSNDFHTKMNKEGHTDRIIDYAKTEFLFFKDREYEFNKLVQNLHTINAYIESKGAKLIIFSAMCDIIDPSKLEGLNFVEFPDGSLQYGSLQWRGYIKSYDPVYRGAHPSVDDQPKLTNILFKYINELGYEY